MAAPNTHIKVAGTWKQVSKMHVKVTGTWKAVSRAYVRVAGTWKKIYDIVVPGNSNYTTPGTYSFNVPYFNTLTVQVWGAGGGSSSDYNSGQNFGAAGGASSFNGTVIANGGGGGHGASHEAASFGGAGGTASGGDTNTTGQAGGDSLGLLADSGKGGDCPNGGTGGRSRQPSIQINGSYDSGDGFNGNFPGGGGSGPGSAWSGTGGGGGGYSSKTYSAGQLTVGSNISVVVGSGGIGGNLSYNGGDGANGRVYISWS